MPGWARTLSVQALVVAVLLLIAEVGLCWLAPVEIQRDQRYERVFEQTLPGLRSEITYSRNRFGLRSTTMDSREKPAGTVRILCLGASTTDQPTQNTEDIWCSLLARELKVPDGIRVETAAFGRGGWKAADLLLWARARAVHFEPDIVVTLLGINDLSLGGGPDYGYSGLEEVLARRPDDPRFSEDEERESELKRRCTELSQLCRRAVLAKRRLEHQLRVWRGELLEWHSEHIDAMRAARADYPLQPAPQREPDPIDEFTDVTAALVDLFLDRGTAVVLLEQPVLWRPDLGSKEQAVLWFPINSQEGFVRTPLDWLAQEMARYNRVQDEIGRARGIPVVPLSRSVPATLRYFFDDCHFTDEGNLAVARAVVPAVQRELDRILAGDRVQTQR